MLAVNDQAALSIPPADSEAFSLSCCDDILHHLLLVFLLVVQYLIQGCLVQLFVIQSLFIASDALFAPGLLLRSFSSLGSDDFVSW